ncbi:7TM diverse intracellular signaling domain-containing protein [Olleya aquimaris]|uniref:histidine kinase n=1 Tax=Olleya aquimaris TaxID=639310 RepID=A0A327RQ91_9FLAO|nr:7TM diverse intracellular signaling domain-containing protein [Olleya aquimaris]RAJ17753.1 signal transduction histidine kinase [Olleya aquimaris]
MRKIFIFIYFISLTVCGQNTPFDPLVSKGELYHYAQYTCLGKTDLTIDEFLTKQDLKFEDLDSDNLNLGFTSDHYWVKFALKNSSDRPLTYYLETARPITDKANLFVIDSASTDIKKFKSGDQIPFSERQVKHRSTVFKLNLEPNSKQDVYMEFASDGETINVPLKLYTESEFWWMNYRQQLLFGLFYGLLLLAGISYLFFYTSLKDKIFLYYGLYVFSIALLQAALDGYIFEFVFPGSGYINSRAVLITGILSNLFLLKYCQYFLRVNKKLKQFKIYYNVIFCSLGVAFIMLFLSPKTMEYAYPLSNINGLVSLVLILGTILTLRYNKVFVDIYFSIGILFLIVGLLGFVMNNLSIIPNNAFTENSVKIGSAIEVIFLSLSMTNLIKRLKYSEVESKKIALNKSQEILQLKSFFMSNISHELRTPINAIMGIAETELEKDADEDTKKNYEIIKNSSISLLSNVNDILDFDKLVRNELELNKEVFNPLVPLNEICNNWKVEAERKGLEFNFIMDSNIPEFVESDSERFIQILNNILSNAVKFTSSGHIEVKINCCPKADNINCFEIQVSDTGVGMTTEVKNKIFESFNQMKNNHKRKFGGIGLGLTIVKKLVHLFGGDLKIESQLNEGTRVFIDLPLKVKKIDVYKSKFPNEDNFLNREVHILAVEDNRLNQMVIKKLLGADNKISLSIAKNGEEAIQMLNKDNFDLILMDLQMPVMDGYEATKLIRSGIYGPKIKSIPIIAVTADAMQQTKEKVLAIGMNDYMTKPVNKKELLQKISKCVNNHLKIA